MTQHFELMVPAIAESQLTGYIGGARINRQKSTLTIDFYVVEPRIRCALDGKSVDWDKLPITAQRTGLSALRMLTTQFS